MTEPYTPTTRHVRSGYATINDWNGIPFQSTDRCAEFDRWFIREIEAAEYSGYLRAKEEAK